MRACPKCKATHDAQELLRGPEGHSSDRCEHGVWKGDHCYACAEKAQPHDSGTETRWALRWALALVTDWVHTIHFDMADFERACKALVNAEAKPCHERSGGVDLRSLVGRALPFIRAACDAGNDEAAKLEQDIAEASVLLANQPHSRRGAPDGRWLIFFEDAEVKPESFGGAGAERGARERFRQISANWNATLFAAVESNFPDETSPHTPFSVKCDKCYRIALNRDLEGQRCGEKLTHNDPGCDGTMQVNRGSGHE